MVRRTREARVGVRLWFSAREVPAPGQAAASLAYRCGLHSPSTCQWGQPGPENDLLDRPQPPGQGLARGLLWWRAGGWVEDPVAQGASLVSPAGHFWSLAAQLPAVTPGRGNEDRPQAVLECPGVLATSSVPHRCTQSPLCRRPCDPGGPSGIWGPEDPQLMLPAMERWGQTPPDLPCCRGGSAGGGQGQEPGGANTAKPGRSRRAQLTEQGQDPSDRGRAGLSPDSWPRQAVAHGGGREGGCGLSLRMWGRQELSPRTCPVFRVRLLEGWPGLCGRPQRAPACSVLERDAGAFPDPCEVIDCGVISRSLRCCASGVPAWLGTAPGP